MEYTIEQLTKEIRVLMDENPDSSMLIETGDVDTLGLDSMIEALLPDVLKAVLLAAAPEELGTGLEFPDTDLAWESGIEGVGMASMVLPDDFLRIVWVQMTDWYRGVNTAISEESPLYALQRTKWGAGRGTPERPVAAVVGQTIGLTLELYSSNTEGAYLKRGRYLAIPKIENGKLEVPERLERTLVQSVANAVVALLNPSINQKQEQ